MWRSEGKRWHQQWTSYCLNGIPLFFSDIVHLFWMVKPKYRSKITAHFFLNGIMVLWNNSIITIWWMVRKPGVGYQFADRLFYNFNVLFLLNKRKFYCYTFMMFLLDVYNLYLNLLSFKNDYWIKKVCKLLL